MDLDIGERHIEVGREEREDKERGRGEGGREEWNGVRRSEGGGAGGREGGGG